MATNKSTSNTPSELFSIEELRRKNETPEKIFEGVKALQGWISGKAVTEDEYETALKEFLECPMGGRKVKKDAKRR